MIEAFPCAATTAIDMRSYSRRRDIVRARQITMDDLAKTVRNLSHPAIGRAFKRDFMASINVEGRA